MLFSHKKGARHRSAPLGTIFLDYNFNSVVNVCTHSGLTHSLCLEPFSCLAQVEGNIQEIVQKMLEQEKEVRQGPQSNLTCT